MKRIILAVILPLLLAAGANDRKIVPVKDGGSIILQSTTSGGVATDALTVTTTGIVTNVPISLKGNVDGSGACTGCVGEYLEGAIEACSANLLTSGTEREVGGGVTIGVGEWSISSSCYFDATTTSPTHTFEACLSSTTTGSGMAGRDLLRNYVTWGGSYIGAGAMSSQEYRRLITTGTETWYPKALDVFTGGSGTCATGIIRAHRVR